MSLRIEIDHAELQPIIQQAVDAALRRLLDERPTDYQGRVLITKTEAARTLGVSPSTLDRLRRESGESGLPSVKLDGKVLFRPESLDSWAKAREV